MQVRSYMPKESRRSDRQMLTRRMTVELGRTLQFSDDVVSSRSPQAVSYTKAKGEMGNIFRPDNLGFALTAPKESTSRRDWTLTNQHYPCHLRGSSAKTQSLQGAVQRCRSRSLPSKTYDSAGTEGRGIGQDHSFLSPRSSWRECSSMPQCSRMVPTSASVLWEEQTLHRLSSATARRLVEECPRARERERLERLLERRPRDRVTEKSASVSLSSSNAGSVGATESTATSAIPDQSSSPPPVKFSDELRAGAKPVHQRGGDTGTSTIVLDSNVSFRKVLQKCYPQQPQEWSQEEDAAPLVGRSCVRGQLRWTDFPQPVKVSEKWGAAAAYTRKSLSILA